MTKNRDPDFLIRLEKALEEKFGKEAVQNVKASWTIEDERKFLQQVAEMKEQTKDKKIEFDEINGILIQKDLFRRDSSCPRCKNYSFKMSDDFYITRYGCCEVCFIKHIEGRKNE